MAEQQSLFEAPAEGATSRNFPQTRYQGSKLKLLDWIWTEIGDLSFDSATDLFGGSASVSYLLKTKAKTVIYNDNLRSNFLIGKALIENSATQLNESDVEIILKEDVTYSYSTFIQDNYNDVFFLDHENKWLDRIAQNIAKLPDPYKQALAYFALFQASLMKRPYNLFHRANLYMRTADVTRSFGNKTTWETPFEVLFRKLVGRANQAVFDNSKANLAFQCNAEEVNHAADLVYIDPPYMNSQGVGVDYLTFYHFLEGLSEYDCWPARVSNEYKHKPYLKRESLWNSKKTINQAFEQIIEKAAEKIIVVSYRDNGIPTPTDICSIFKRHGRKVRMAEPKNYKYALSKSSTNELLFIAD